MNFYNRSLQNDFLPKERKIVFYKPPIHSNLHMISLKYRVQVDWLCKDSHNQSYAK